MADSNFRFPVRVTNMRKGGGNALAFFNVEYGIETKAGVWVPFMVGKDFVLKNKKDGGYFYQAPSKPRIKAGEHQIGDDGYKIYDDIIALYGEKGAGQGGPDKWSPTKAAFAARKQITEDAVTSLKALAAEAGGRGSAPEGKATAVAAVGAEAGDVNTLFGGDDDDMPF